MRVTCQFSVVLAHCTIKYHTDLEFRQYYCVKIVRIDAINLLSDID